MFFKFASLFKGYLSLFWAILATAFLAAILINSPAFSDSIKYEYDELGRLIIVSDTDDNLTDYNFDPAGNRTDSDVVVPGNAGPKFTLSDAIVNEGGTMTFVVTLHNGAGATYAIDYATEDDGAVAPGDYTTKTGTLTFSNATGTISQNVTVVTISDTTNELDNERLILRLSNATGGAGIFDDEGQGYILTGDSKNRPPVGGNQATSPGTFFTTNLPQSIQVTDIGCEPDGDLLTIVSGSIVQPTHDITGSSGGTATAFADLTGIDLTVDGGAGDYTFSFTVQDPFGSTDVATRTYFIDFEDPGGGGGPPLAPLMMGGGSCGAGFEASPDNTSFAIDDVSAVEGSNLVFTVTKTGSSSETNSLSYSTSNGTAADGDYTPLSGGLTFSPGQTSKTITIATTVDGEAEVDETVDVNLIKVSGPGTISDALGVGTIQNGGPPPDNASFSIDDVQVTEGGDLVFTVTKSGTATATYTVDFATADGTATLADSDYTTNSGMLAFLDTETTKTITVATTGDGTPEADETVLVNLSNPSGTSTITDAQGVGTIINDDGAPDNASFSIDDVSVTEGGNLIFTVTKAGTASVDYSVDFATADGTATSADYTANSGTLTFTSVETTKTITVVTLQDALVEGDETVLVNLSNPTGTSTITDNQGVGTINDDEETPPSFAIDDVNVTEGGNLVYTVTKTGTVSGTYDVDFATADGTATTADYTANSGTLSFLGADTTKTITVITTQDTTYEGNETVLANLSNPTAGATITDTQGVGTINEDDTAPSFSIDDVSVEEGLNLVFTVTKTGSTALSHDVDFATANGTATTANNDYTANSGTLTFLNSETTKTITVVTIEDSTVESDETLFVNLTNATNGATISDSQGVGTIENDDTAPNQPPTANDDSYLFGFFEGEINDLDVLLNDTDPDSDPLTITSLSNIDPGFNIATISCSNTCVRVSSGIGTFTLTYHISDGNGGTDSATLTYRARRDFGAFAAEPVSFSVADVTQTEGQNFNFQIVKTGTTSESITISYFTEEGSASSPQDYTGVNGSVTFEANETVKTIIVSSKDDNKIESQEIFRFKIANPTGSATITDDTADGVIEDNDTPGGGS